MLKKLKRLLFSRVFIVGLLILLQFVLLLVAALRFTEYFVFYFTAIYALAIVYVIRIVNTHQNMAYKLAWVVLISFFPAFGVTVYEIFCGNRLSKRSRSKMQFMRAVTESSVSQKSTPIEKLREEDKSAAKQSDYILSSSNSPLYEKCRTEYFPSGEEFFPELLSALEKAERYIFLEYFIIGKGEMWNKIHEILKEKASCGVDVRVIFDDIGCITTLDRKFPRSLEADGIKCKVFHRFLPVLNARQNNRDHRKICVVDGTVAFTGGINLADEYINTVDKHGYWKDNAVLLEGAAAWSFTVMFLSMWDYLNKTPEEKRGQYSEYYPHEEEIAEFEVSGYVQPYTDSPLDTEPVGENVYLGIIYAAEKYIWITTPYLIIDERMEEALCYAAKCGVDVRIITPGVPDKKFVNETTKSYYKNLIDSGVKIYEFTPGFIHAKTFICDDKYATVGSVNLDYRSLYLHFECGLWMYKTDSISDIKRDYENTLKESKYVENGKNSLVRRLFRSVLELFAPLM